MIAISIYRWCLRILQQYDLMTLGGNRCVGMNLQRTLMWATWFFIIFLSFRWVQSHQLYSKRFKAQDQTVESLHVVKQRVPGYTVTHKRSLLCKWLGLLTGFPDFIFNYTHFFPLKPTIFFYLFVLFFFFSFFLNISPDIKLKSKWKFLGRF